MTHLQEGGLLLPDRLQFLHSGLKPEKKRRHPDNKPNKTNSLNDLPEVKEKVRETQKRSTPYVWVQIRSRQQVIAGKERLGLHPDYSREDKRPDYRYQKEQS
ncbi:MAG: hypothetical protein WAV09_01875 [Minisyncoccia bacterium]